MRLIDADTLKPSIGCTDAVKYGNKTAEQQRNSYSTMMMYEIADIIDDEPTIDAVPVVRCKDCGHWRQDVNNLYGCMHWYCTHLLRKTMPDDYCNHGAKTGNKEE